jgi:hypothetical protein
VLARASAALGERGRQAYRITWADGAPHYQLWELRDLHDLFVWLREPPPQLPATREEDIEIAQGATAREFVRLNAKRRRRIGP